MLILAGISLIGILLIKTPSLWDVLLKITLWAIVFISMTIGLSVLVLASLILIKNISYETYKIGSISIVATLFTMKTMKLLKETPTSDENCVSIKFKLNLKPKAQHLLAQKISHKKELKLQFE